MPVYCSGWPFLSPGDLPNSGMELRSLSLQGDSLPAEPQGKPENTGVGSLSLLQQIFLTQELNQSLLHCRRIPYQLSYQGRPNEFARAVITKIAHTERLKNQKLSFSRFWRLGMRSRGQQGCCLLRPLSLVCGWLYSLCVLM